MVKAKRNDGHCHCRVYLQLARNEAKRIGMKVPRLFASPPFEDERPCIQFGYNSFHYGDFCCEWSGKRSCINYLIELRGSK